MRFILPFFLLIFSSTVWAEENFGTKVGETDEYNVYIDMSKNSKKSNELISTKKVKINSVWTTLEIKPKGKPEKIGDTYNAVGGGYSSYYQPLDCKKRRFITVVEDKWISSIVTIPEEIKVGTVTEHGHNLSLVYTKPNFLGGGVLIDEKISNAIFDKVCR